MRTARRARRPLVALVTLVAALAVGYGVRALGNDDGGSGPTTRSATSAAAGASVAVSRLPGQVAATVARIERGGPFPFPDNDGAVFHNAEHRLPPEPDGYYREYTVPTPGSPDRGSRRIIRARSGEYWYTGDHYNTFRRLDLDR